MNDIATLTAPAAETPSRRRPRLGFLGVGWIGRHRMEAIQAADAGIVAAIADPDAGCREAARAAAPDARLVNGLDDLLSLDLDGLVIATPSAQHAEQARLALAAGTPVFCQKPLGRTAEEVAAVVAAARASDRLLAVDLSYRFTAAARRIRELVRAGTLGEVFAADLVFHNAYGPDKPWFYDAAQSGGGCVMDLGVHLVDLALWALDFPTVEHVAGDLIAAGRPAAPGQVEDFATASITLANGAVVRLACSWRLHAGQDAEIGAAFYGTAGGAAMRNVGGSFYDFTAERFSGTARERLAEPPDAWGGRAAVAWAERLSADPGFDAEADRLIDVAAVLDRIYGR